ncbi:MAG: glycosyltransferase [Thermoplasmatales archaeon]|nr:glycosyltransferase [Thermoplasmatales archaeon]
MTGAVLSYKRENVSNIKLGFKREDVELFSKSLSKFTGVDFSRVVDDYSEEINGLMGYLAVRKDELQVSGLTKMEVMAFLTLNIVSSFSLWLGFKSEQIYSKSLEKVADDEIREQISSRVSKNEVTSDYKSGVVIPTNLVTMDEVKLHLLEELIKSLNSWENLSCIWIVGKIPNHTSKILGSCDNVEIINVEEDRGPAKARNIGIDMALEAGIDLLVFMDDDVVNPVNDKFKTVCNDAVKTTNLYSPKIESYRYTCFDMFHNLDGTLNGVYESNSELTNLVYGTTCVMIAPIVVFESGIRFDENFPLAAGEDIDFCIRVKANGHKIIPADDLVIKHDYGYWEAKESLKKFVSRFFRYGEGNRVIKERQPEYFNTLTSALRRTTTMSKKKKWEVPESIEMLSIIVERWFY